MKGIYTAVIVDNRITDIFELVLNNFYKNLDERWNFLIFVTNNNKDFLINLINTSFSNQKNRTTIIKLDIDQPILAGKTYFTHYDYSLLMTTKKFYELIPTEIFLIFQLDCLLSDKYHDNIYNFIDYDFTGAPFPHQIGGNGGFSLRKKSKIIKILEDDNYRSLYNNKFYHEDGYFCLYPEINLPDRNLAKTFSVETFFYDKSAAIHQAYLYLNDDQINQLQTHIPQIRELEKRFKEMNKNRINIFEYQSLNPKINFFDNYQIINF